MKLRYLLILTAVFFSVLPLYAEFCRNCGKSEYFLQDGECVKCTMQKYTCSVCGENPAVVTTKVPCALCGKKVDLSPVRICFDCMKTIICDSGHPEKLNLPLPKTDLQELLKQQGIPNFKPPEIPKFKPPEKPKFKPPAFPNLQPPEKPKYPTSPWEMFFLAILELFILLFIKYPAVGFPLLFIAGGGYLIYIIRKKRAAAKAAASDSAVTDFQRLDSGKFSGSSDLHPSRQNSTVQTGDIAAKSATGKKQQ